MYLRKMNNKRRRTDKLDVDVDQILAAVAQSLKRHMDLDVTAPPYRALFLRCLSVEVFQTKQYRRRMMQAIKLFLKEAHMKTKGYTAKLRHVMTTIHAQLNLLEDQAHTEEAEEEDRPLKKRPGPPS